MCSPDQLLGRSHGPWKAVDISAGRMVRPWSQRSKQQNGPLSSEPGRTRPKQAVCACPINRRVPNLPSLTPHGEAI